MNVLLVGMSNRNFLPDLQQNLSTQNITADLLDLLEGYFIDSNLNKTVFGRKIQSKNFLKKNLQLFSNFRKAFILLSKRKVAYDICNIHFLDVRYYFFKRKLCKLADRLVISTYGTDFYKYSKYAFLQKPFYKKASRITFANELTKAAFDTFYQSGFSNKLAISRFGLSLLPLIKEVQNSDDFTKKARTDFGFPHDKIIITIGYNSSPNNQHVKIIDELVKLTPELKNKIFLVFPMTYGGFTHYINEVKTLMDKTGIPYRTLKKYLSTEELISLRLSSDIMINLPVSDQLSATMCEYLYTRNWVITAKWLPYESIDQTGVNYDRIESFDQLTVRMEEILLNFAHFTSLTEQNPERIWNFSSWNHNINAWIDVYSA